MVFITSLPPASAGAPASAVQPQQLLQAQAAASASPTAQALLPSAVVAAALVPRFANDVPKQPKPVSRNGTAQPSSMLAAQFLAQSPEVSEETFGLFALREDIADRPEPPPPHEAELFVTPRSPEEAQHAAPLPPSASVSAALSIASLATALVKAGQPAEKAAQLLPFTVQQAFVGKKGLIQTRGADAYLLTNTRNNTPSTRAAVEAIS